MLGLTLLALIAGVAVSSMWSFDDEIDETDTITPEETPTEKVTNEEEADTGATVEETEDGFYIDVGEDETREVAVIYFTDSQDDPDDFYYIQQARFYLVPEGVELPENSYEDQWNIPGRFDEEGNEIGINLTELEEYLGLELIEAVDVKNYESSTDTPAGVITSNADFEEFYLEAVTDGDYLVSLLPVDYEVTVNGVAEISVWGDVTATNSAEWITTQTDGATIYAEGGDDILGTAFANNTIYGGEGDDDITTTGENVAAYGDEGNDTIIITSGKAAGGDGDDRLYNPSSENSDVRLYGGAGDDNVSVHGATNVGHGWSGDDFMTATSGALVYGNEGNDTLSIGDGSRGNGGDGDDTFNVVNQFTGDGVTLTGGKGADTYNALVRNAYSGTAENIYMTITDFDPEEDILNVGTFYSTNEVDHVDIIEAADGNYTDVLVTFTGRYQDESEGEVTEGGIATIRLEGVTGMTAEHVNFV